MSTSDVFNHTSTTHALGARVAYLHDTRITGTVVGYTTIHNAYDERADVDMAIPAALVVLDAFATHPVAHTAFSHVAFAHHTLIALVGE